MKRLLTRSALFVPGDRLKAIEKAVNLPADVVIIDLEDAVGADTKVSARKQVVDFLKKDFNSKYLHQSLVVRVNCPFTSEWGFDDLDAIGPVERVSAILLPKVNDEIHINRTIEHLHVTRGASLGCGRAATRLAPPLWAMVETAKGIINANNIAASIHISALVFGSNDLSKELRTPLAPSRLPLLYSLSKVVCAARAHDKIVIDGVHMDIKDKEGLRAVCQQGRELGFDGKSLIHPDQVDICNEEFSPSIHDVTWASKVIEAYNAAMNAGKGVCVVDGKLVEALHVQQAHDILNSYEVVNMAKKTTTTTSS